MQFSLGKCKVCGKQVLSKTGKSELCNDKSTCRVAWSRKQKAAAAAAQAEAEKMTVPLEAFELYKTIIEARPNCKSSLDYMLEAYGKGAFQAALFVASNCIVSELIVRDVK